MADQLQMRVLERVQYLEAPVEEIWEYLAAPKSLLDVAPNWVRLEILSADADQEVQQGQLLKFRYCPYAFLPFKHYWETEVTRAEKHVCFEATQRKGIYRYWRHENSFKTIDGGTEVRDMVYYSLPWGVWGEVAFKVFIRRELNDILNHRQQKLAERFGEMKME